MSLGLSLGALRFNWKPDTIRDFYFRIADEAAFDTVFLGEVVCSKRAPFTLNHLAEVVERLEAAGKQVCLSSLALIMQKREIEAARELAAPGGANMVEANDLGVASLLVGQRFALGPMVNVYNGGTLDYLAGMGAVRACLPAELPHAAIRALAGRGIELEVQAFGRVPLAVSARCYHARSRSLAKDNCQYVCAEDPDGMDLDTLDGQAFLTVNGTETMARTFLCLLGDIALLREIGVSHLRLWPHSVDMVAVADLFRKTADEAIDPYEAEWELRNLCGDIPLANGFLHGQPGHRYASRA